MLTRHDLTTLLLQPVSGVAPAFILDTMREDFGHLSPADLSDLFCRSGGGAKCEYIGGGLYRII